MSGLGLTIPCRAKRCEGLRGARGKSRGKDSNIGAGAYENLVRERGEGAHGGCARSFPIEGAV